MLATKNKVSTQTPEYWVEYRARVKQEALDNYGAICVCCGTTYVPHLTLDHVDGGGHQERKKKKGLSGWKLAKLEDYPDRFQIMCFNCNWAKHYEGECHCQEVGE